MARLSEHGLRKSVGVSGLFATAYGNVGSSIYYALGLVAAHALGLTPLVFVFAGGLFALTAKTYAEGASMFPEAGGSSSFARHAFDDVVSFFAGWALSLDYILTIAISAFFVPHYLSAFPGLGALKHNPDDIFGGLIVVAVLAWLNIRGLGESAKLNIVLALLDLLDADPARVLGFVLVLNPLAARSTRSTSGSRAELEGTDLRAVAGDARVYGHRDGREHGRGVQGSRQAGAEGRQPRRARGARRVRGHLGRRALGAAGHAPRRRLQRASSNSPSPRRATRPRSGGFFENDPMLGVVEHLGLHGTVLKLGPATTSGILAATILFIATNAGMIGISRLSWSLSEHRQLPQLFSQLHPSYRTPWFTLIFFSMLASTLIIYGNTEVLGNLYSFGAMLSFTTAHAAIVALRVSDPDRERPYSTPWGVRIKGSVIPMAAVIGGIGTFAAWVAVTVLHTEAKIVGIPWMVIGMGGYFIYRKRQGLDPRKSYKIAARRAPGRTSRSSSTGPRSCRSSATTSAPRRSAAPPS